MFSLLIITMLLASGRAWAGQTKPVFHRGVSLSSWFANAPRQPLDERDFAQIRRVGFDHVRLPVDPEYFGFRLIEGRRPSRLSGGYARVDRAIDLARGKGLRVILDIHPQAEFRERLEDNPWAEDQFAAYWTLLAHRYKDVPDDVLAYELLNEPQYYGNAAAYGRLVARLVAAIRIENPGRWIVVGGVQSSAIETLSALKPLDDPRIIYAFHFYMPFMITHQGINMGFDGMMLRYFRKVPYPSSLVDKDAGFYAPGASDPAQARMELTRYRNENWGPEKIASSIRKAREWADAHKAPVICGEFGVLRTHNDARSRYRWIADVRSALDANNIGWQIWDYTDLFGIAQLVGQVSGPDEDGSIRLLNPRKGMRIIEREAITALGLSPAGPTAESSDH
jgi:endoglucanase